ncbi:MAG: type IV pilus biogenesis/stability protein PilW [Gammaproteobacteria bacterium]|nr:type IV pilus biogenesis/stability protein PilW [Gammaproteobacteria bacterium]
MNPPITSLVSAVLLVLLISGCATNSTRTNQRDGTGDLGDENSLNNQGAGTIYVRLAIEYFRNGQVEIALKQAKKALDVEPDSVQARTVIARIYEQLGEVQQAEQQYKEGIRLQPLDPYIRNAYGALLCGQRRYGEAVVQFEKALENPLYTTPEVALTNAGVCELGRNNLDQAESYLRLALQRNPRYAVALSQMSLISYQNGDFLAARAYLTRYLDVAGHTPGTLWLGIRIERELQDKDAVASYSMILRNQFPDSREVQLLRAWESQ